MSEDSDWKSSLSTVLKGGSVLFLGVVFELGISFLGKLAIARFLGPFDYGSVVLGLTIMSFVTSFVLLGIDTGVGRFLPRYDDVADRRGVLVAGLSVGLAAGIATGVALFVAAPWLARSVFDQPELTTVFRIFAVIVPLSNLMRISIGAVQGMQDSLPRVYIENVTQPLTRLLGFAAVVFFGLGAVGAAWAYLASYATAGLLGTVYLVRRTPLFGRGSGVNLKTRELFAFSLPLVFSAIISSVYQDIDTLLLGYFAISTDVGIYNVVYSLAKLLLVGLQAVGFIFMPVLSGLHEDGDETGMRRLYQIVTKWLFSGTLPLFLVVALFPTMTIKITFGPEYLPAADVLPVLAVAFFTHAVLGPNNQMLTSIGKTRTILYDTVAAAALNLALNIVLIPRYGLLGAAVATAGSYVLLNALYSYQLYRATGIHPFSTALVLPGVVGGLLVATIYTLTQTFLTVTLPLLVVLFVVFVGTYGIAILRFGIEESEIELVLKFEEKYDVDLGPFKIVAKWFMDL
jgi:O-antigen/teichoic acid export membrane protein